MNVRSFKELLFALLKHIQIERNKIIEFWKTLNIQITIYTNNIFVYKKENKKTWQNKC